MKIRSLIVYLILVFGCSAGYVVLLKSMGQQGAYLAQGFMLLPALAAIITRLFFDPQHFKDAGLKFGSWGGYLRFWLYGLGISMLFYFSYALAGAGRWDLSGKVFLDRLAQQFAAVGQDIQAGLPAGMTPFGMLMLYFIGGLTIFNVLPGIITGLGEEFGWRGLMFVRMLAIRPWVAYVVGGILWGLWHMLLMLVIPQSFSGAQLIWQVLISLAGTTLTGIYLGYAYLKTGSIFTAAIAHITMNNAAASFGYFFVIENPFLANLCTVMVMAVIVTVLFATGELRVFRAYRPVETSQ